MRLKGRMKTQCFKGGPTRVQNAEEPQLFQIISEFSNYFDGAFGVCDPVCSRLPCFRNHIRSFRCACNLAQAYATLRNTMYY